MNAALHRFAYAVVLTALLVGRAEAQIPLDGWFIALHTCPAYQSFQKQTNPGDVVTTVDRAYPLYGKNAAVATHYLVDVHEAAPNRRWVAATCGVRVIAAESAVPPPPVPTPATGPMPTHTPDGHAHGGDAVFAVSWQPAFCETKPSKPECTSMTGDRFDATHLTLHGLWPQPQGVEYCGISAAQQQLDRDKHWDQLDPVDLTASTRDLLARVMPGTQSHLERHEWTRHGSCYGTSADDYFRAAAGLVAALDESSVQAFLASRIGTSVDTNDIRHEFDQAFGGDAGSRVAFFCAQDGGRNLLTEMRINVRGTIDEHSDLGALMLAAPTVKRGCGSGVVDPVGLQ
jgi:ribonuclease T2